MAVHHVTSQGWFDTPCNPLVGVLMFLVGFTALMVGALYLAAFLLR